MFDNKNAKDNKICTKIEDFLFFDKVSSNPNINSMKPYEKPAQSKNNFKDCG